MSPTAPEAIQNDKFTPEDRNAALQASRALSSLPSGVCLHVEVEADHEPRQSFTLPAKAVHLLTEMLIHLAQGRGVAVMPDDAELTTQQAAEMLNVSRPYFIRLLDERKIPHHLAGTHRRIKLDDLLTYKRQRDARSARAMEELASEAQALDMGY
jgi:excisionase family DNA binding protein